MSNQKRTFPGRTQARLAFVLILLVVTLTGCGGGSSGGSGNPGSPTAAALKADAGPICETRLTGEIYTNPLPLLSCNNGPDIYTAYLDGSKSTSLDGSPLSYSWSFLSKPAGSTVQLTGANTAKPTFVPDKAGPYRVQLVVSANGVSSQRAVALVVALDNAALNLNLASNPTGRTYPFHGGLSSNCAGCHTNSFPVLPTKPSTHVATSNLCQSCHSPLGFAVTDFVDHKEVFGTCSGCHDGIIATGKSVAHVDTTQECSDCHQSTIHFVPLTDGGTFSHASLTEPCSACHNGVVAIGTESDPNPAGHPSIASECNGCHDTTTFTTPFPDHTNPKVVVPETCGQAGCHDGNSVLASGKQIPGQNSAPHPHIDTGTSTACDLCHGITTFNLGGVFSHSVLGRLPAAGITVECATCHDGLNAIGVPAPTPMFTHQDVSAGPDCSRCHSTADFAILVVDHSGFDATTDCTNGSCHNGTDAPGAPTDSIHDVTTNPEFSTTLCGLCHTPGGTFLSATIDHSASKFGTLGNPLVDCTGCHDGTTPATSKPLGHMATTDNCGFCHSPQSTTFAGGIYNHSTVSVVNGTATPACASCHDGSTATGQSLTHVPLPTPGMDCLVCHGTGFSSFTLSPFDHSAAGITSNCSSCHDGKLHDTTLVRTKPSIHIPTSADCSTCHQDKTNGPGINGTSASGYTVADPFVNTVHPAYTTGCRLCHNGQYDNSIYNARGHPADSVHDTVDANGWECKECHTTTGNFMETNPVNHKDPVVQAQPCVSCHVAGNTVEPIGKSATHPQPTPDTCQDCHQPGGSFTAGFDHAGLDVVGGPNYKRACTTCHDGLNATGKPSNHMPSTQDCVSCHLEHPPTASTFAGGIFDHTGPEMTGRKCMDCHDGSILGALGKNAKPDHKVTTEDCGACHSTTAFKPATSFDHSGVTSGCQDSGCHTSGNPEVIDVTDDPNPNPHIPIMNGGTEVDCYNCHKQPGGTFANAVMDHTVVTSFTACESCHGGTPKYDGANTAHVVTTKPSNHFVESIASCKSCHKSTSAWTVGVTDYNHPNGSGYPGNHSASKVTKCSQCHNDTPANADISTFPLSPYGSQCAACHWQKGTGEHGNPLRSDHYNCGNSGCHSVSKSSFNK